MDEREGRRGASPVNEIGGGDWEIRGGRPPSREALAEIGGEIRRSGEIRGDHLLERPFAKGGAEVHSELGHVVRGL